MTIYTVEIQAHTGADGVATFYIASKRFNTTGDDAPAHRHFHPALKVPANFERALFSSGDTTGTASIGFGVIEIANAHGRYDAWVDYAFDGRPCIVKAIPEDGQTGQPLWSYRDAPVLIRGTVESIDTSNAFSTIRLKLYDRMTDLDQPLLSDRYGGATTGGGAGADGAEGLKDTLKPRIYGAVLNVAPIDVNPFDLIRQVSDRSCSSITVYDGGLYLAFVGDVADLTALTAATVLPGQYATCFALGLIRLGGVPASTVTADVVASGPSDAAGIVKAMLLDFGLDAGEIDDASFAALTVKNPAPCGIWITDETSVLALANAVLRSVGGWIVPDGRGVYSVGRLEAPGGAPIAAFQEWQIRGAPERQVPADSNRGIPAYRVVVRYGRLWRTQGENEVAGAVAAARRTALAQQWREVKAEAPSVKARHLLAQAMVFETCLLDAADAEAEAVRLLGIYSTRRDVWRIAVDMTGIDYRADQSVGEAYAMPIGLGRTVSLRLARFLAPARLFVVIARVEDCDAGRIQFDLWG